MTQRSAIASLLLATALLGPLGLATTLDAPPGRARAAAELTFSDVTEDGSTDLFAITLAEGQRRELLASPGLSESDPAWSPDGRRLAFSAPAAEQDRGIFLLDAGSQEIIAVTDGPVDLEPAWSPEGEWIAYARRTELDGVIQSSALALVRPDGREQRILTLIEGSARIIGRPSWSPDGQRIAFALRQEAGGGADLYVIGRDGAGLTRLLGQPGWDDVDPAWSPDGRRIAFASGPFERASALSRHAIWLLDLDSGLVGTIVTAPGETDLRRPAWSPDGRQLAFDAGPRGSLARQIHVLPAEGGPLESPLTPGFAAAWRSRVDPPSSPSPTGTAAATPTDVGLPTPVNSTTPIVEPTVPVLPTLAPFPTFPPPEPTLPGPAPTFPPPTPSATRTASPSATIGVTPVGAAVYLPVLLRLEPEPATPTAMPGPGTPEPTPGPSPAS